MSKSPTPTEKSGIGDRGRGSPTFEKLLSKAWRKFFEVLIRIINAAFYQMKLKVVYCNRCHYFLILYQKGLLKILQKIIDYSLKPKIGLKGAGARGGGVIFFEKLD